MAVAWHELEARQQELTALLLEPSLDASKRPLYQKELSQIANLIDAHKELMTLTAAVEDAKKQALENKDPELASLFEEEIQELSHQIEEKQNALDDILFPADERDNRSVFLEIRAGTGGQEAALFASNLATMYTNYALQRHWKVSVEGLSSTDLGGCREVILHIQGKGVFGFLKWESGVHRVQRVPKTETQGRIHTSTATVAVMPEAEDIEVSINPADLRIDVYRASGAGGQHVNTTDSAVRITHIPTGTVVSCQDERSQHKNKAKAMKVLQSRILAVQLEKKQAEQSKQRKEQVGTGQRSEKVRTYNFPQNRVTDHQANITLNKLDMVIEGDLDEIIQALRQTDRELRKEKPLFWKQS